MKILLISVSSQVSRGGIAVWTDRFLEKCGSHGIEYDLVNTETVGKRREQSTVKLNLFDETTRTKRIFAELKKFLKSGEAYNAAHLNTSCGTFGLFRDYICAKRIKKKGIRLVTHFHCDVPYWIGNPISRRYLGKLVSLSDECLVLCENSRAYLEENFSKTSHKLPNFLDESMVFDGEKRIAETVNTVFFVGRVEEAKGAREIFELAGRFPRIRFRLVGDVNENVAAWDKPQNVELVGGLPHAQALAEMDNADVFLFPSHSEGFSLALTEAMARGLPCIATDVGANADMLEGECGIIVPKGDVDAMDGALRRLLDHEIREKISQNAVNKVRGYYTTDKVIRKLKKFYLES